MEKNLQSRWKRSMYTRSHNRQKSRLIVPRSCFLFHLSPGQKYPHTTTNAANPQILLPPIQSKGGSYTLKKRGLHYVYIKHTLAQLFFRGRICAFPLLHREVGFVQLYTAATTSTIPMHIGLCSCRQTLPDIARIVACGVRVHVLLWFLYMFYAWKPFFLAAAAEIGMPMATVAAGEDDTNDEPATALFMVYYYRAIWRWHHQQVTGVFLNVLHSHTSK